jgi:1-phosphofructokinase
VIVTLTPNPSVDRTLHLDTLVRGHVNRARSVTSEPSGKGVNVSLALHTTGTATTAVLPVGGPVGAELVDLLRVTGLPIRPVPIAGGARCNVSVVEADGVTTKINEAGPTLLGTEVTALLAEAEDACAPGDWLAICGSLPSGFEPDQLRSAVVRARRAGLLVAVDTSETALLELLAGRAEELPDLVKPNTHELASATQRALTTVGDVVDAAQVLRDRGVATVLVSLGGDGALLVDGAGEWFGTAPVPRVVNTVGAGDSFLAGYLADAARPGLSGTDQEAALASALTWGAIAVQHAGTVFPGLPPAARRPQASIREPDRSQPLSEPAH